jgi:hypothetical protein
VDPLRLLPAERLVQQHVLGRGREPLLGADDVRDLHQVVVDDVGQVVGRKAVRLEQHLIVYLRDVDRFGVGAQPVAEVDVALQRHRQPDRVRLAGAGAPGRIGSIERAAVAVVARGLLGRLLLLAQLGQPLRGAEAAVRPAAVDQLLRMVGIDRQPLGLMVGAMRATHVGSLVPAQTEPAQRLHDLRLAVGTRASLVGVLDAQDERPTALAGKDMVEQRDVGGSDVGVAGGRRRNAHANRARCDGRLGCHGSSPSL